MQKSDSWWRPIAYTSRSLSETERRYAQIEEALACTWACEKFSTYILRMKFLIEIVAQLPASTGRLEVFQKAQAEDSVCASTIRYCQRVWPEKYKIEAPIGKLMAS